MTKPANNRNVVYTDRVITLYFAMDDHLATGNSLNEKKLKHWLIFNLAKAYGISAEQIIKAIDSAITEHNKVSLNPIDFKLFKKSAHSSYLKKEQITEINFENIYDCHIRISKKEITEEKPNSENGYHESIKVRIKTSDNKVKTWVQRHKKFLHRLNMFMNRDRFYRDDTLKKLLKASKGITAAAKSDEVNNIEITPAWYRKHINKELLNTPTKLDNPYYAELFVFPVNDDDFVPVCLLRINNDTGYIRINFPNIDRRSVSDIANVKDDANNLSSDYRDWSLEENKYQISFQLEKDVLQLSIKIFESEEKCDEADDDKSDDIQVLAEYAVQFINEKPKIINAFKKSAAKELSIFNQPAFQHGDKVRIFESDKLQFKKCVSDIANQRDSHSAEQIQAVLKHFDKQLALPIEATFTALQYENDEECEEEINAYTIKSS